MLRGQCIQGTVCSGDGVLVGEGILEGGRCAQGTVCSGDGVLRDIHSLS